MRTTVDLDYDTLIAAKEIARMENTSLGKVIGRSFAAAEMPDVISKIIDVYLAQRQPGENFIETYRRLGAAPFKEAVNFYVDLVRAHGGDIALADNGPSGATFRFTLPLNGGAAS